MDLARISKAALVPLTSFRGETSDGLAKCRLFSHPTSAAAR